MIERGQDVLDALAAETVVGEWIIVGDLRAHHYVIDLEGATIGAKLSSLEDDGLVEALRNAKPTAKRWRLTPAGWEQVRVAAYKRKQAERRDESDRRQMAS